MRLRSAVPLSALFLLVGLSGCVDEGYEITDLSNKLTVDPLFFAANEDLSGFDPVNFTAMVGGTATAATWTSSVPAVATVNPTTGVVTPLSSGFTAITATVGSREKSASLTVNAIPGISIVSGQVVAGIGGAAGAQFLYRILIPAGKTGFSAQLSGGTGDMDLIVREDAVPNYTDYDCYSAGGTNNESCIIANPTVGVLYYILVDVYATGAGAQLVVTLTP